MGDPFSNRTGDLPHESFLANRIGDYNNSA